MEIITVPTKPFDGQKMGTSGLRKKVKVFSAEHYLANFVQSVFTVIKANDPTGFPGCTLVVGGDGRYWNNEAVGIISQVAFANGVGKILLGQNGLISTPAVSHLIRKLKAYGGIIMTASHNPAGPENDWGCKYNGSNGSSILEDVTDAIYEESKKISEITMLAQPPIFDPTKIGVYKVGDSQEIEVIPNTPDWVDLMQEIFDFPAIKKLLDREDFSICLDSMHGVGGPYARAVFLDTLGCPESSMMRSNCLPDFGGGHPDPNLTYAHDLVDLAKGPNAASLCAAFDGDCDRNMILGGSPYTFISPSDSLAIIVANAAACIPYFRKNGVLGVARSMPTGMAPDVVAKKLGIGYYEVPTGWKYFCNLLDAGKANICGEESFGTGSDHIREKDGIWAALAWLSILAVRNADTPVGSLVTVRQIQCEFWREFGRSLYVRYDYEEVELELAKNMMALMNQKVANEGLKGQKFGEFTVETCDNFTYHDPVDGSVSANQGIRVHFVGGTRFVLRLSGTGSVGATIRLYLEMYQQPGHVDVDVDAVEAIKPLAEVALQLSQLKEITSRDIPTVIT